MVHDFLQSNGFFELSQVKLVKPEPLPSQILKRIHSEQYLDKVRQISLTGEGEIDIDTPGFKGIFENASVASGGTLSGVRAIHGGAIDHFLSPTGGFHHARFNSGGGFCIFNDVAAAVFELKDLGYDRILIADFDVHHGNGTQEYFYSDPSVMIISFHEDPEWMYPHDGFIEDTGGGAGTGLNINMHFPMDSGDGVYRFAFDELVPPLLDFFQPQFIIFLPGFDAHYMDRLAHLTITTDMIRYVTKNIHSAAHRWASGKLAVLSGGGYHPDSFLWGVGTVMSVLTGHSYMPPKQNPPFEDDEETWATVKGNVLKVKEIIASDIDVY